MDAMLGKRTSKIKKLSKLAISRITILKRQHEARASHARSDVVELLNLGDQERALVRAETLIKEQNTLDAFLMIEAYCHILVQKIALVQKHKRFPDELREAFATLSYASSRCGEFPELLEIRRTITNKYGDELTARAVELPSNCGVNPKVIQKLSRRQPDLVSRIMALEEIASENGISLHLVNINKVHEKSQEVGITNERPEMGLANKSIEFQGKTGNIAKEDTANNEEHTVDVGRKSFESANCITLSRSDSDGSDRTDDLDSSINHLKLSSRAIELDSTAECTSTAGEYFANGKENIVHRMSTNRIKPMSK